MTLTSSVPKTLPALLESAPADRTAIVLPELPKGWGVVDTQVFPSAYGPSVELVLEPRKDERLSLFAPDEGSDDLLVIGGNNYLKAEGGEAPSGGSSSSSTSSTPKRPTISVKTSPSPSTRASRQISI